MSPSTDEIATFAREIRKTSVRMCIGRGQGYVGQALGLADIMAYLYLRAMRSTPGGYYKDRLVLSTGHSAIAIFATLGCLGLYDESELVTYGMPGSRIEESPLEGTQGFEVTGGSLGQGLSQAVGLALGERFRGNDTTIFCIISDGELQEGQVWEAAMSAGHHKAANLVVLIDNNRMQADGDTAHVMTVEPIHDKFAAFGFDVDRIDAHDLAQIEAAIPVGGTSRERPVAIVCDTVPGKGSPTIENYRKVHYVRADSEVWQQALAELDARA